MRYGDGTIAAGRTVRRAVLACALLLGVNGCRHKPVLPALPPISEPVTLATSVPQEPPPTIEPPEIELPPVPVASGGSPRRERRHRPTQANVPAAQSNTDITQPPVPPEEVAIGALSLGGDANPRAQQEVAELLASIDKRLSGLPSDKAKSDRSQVSRIRNFQRQAQEALSSGDVEGAKTLGTKAKLLLDDLEK